MSTVGAIVHARAHACDRCLTRAWLVARLSGHLDRAGPDLDAVLSLGDEALIAALGGGRAEAIRSELAALAPESVLQPETGVSAVCRCDEAYPARLRDLAAPPAVVFVAGPLARLTALAAEEAVAIVGARRPTSYGRRMADQLAAGLAAAGLWVISGMAFGVDSAAHAGALALGGATAAVLPGGADVPYPATQRHLYARLLETGVAVSELPPGTRSRRWCYPARNRIIAALSAATVVVEAGTGSGSLITAAVARDLGRGLGAVPGRVGPKQADGPNAARCRAAWGRSRPTARTRCWPAAPR